MTTKDHDDHKAKGHDAQAEQAHADKAANAERAQSKTPKDGPTSVEEVTTRAYDVLRAAAYDRQFNAVEYEALTLLASAAGLGTANVRVRPDRP